MARPASDEEHTPLLNEFGDDAQETNPNPSSSLSERINNIAQEPLTPLTKILLVLGLVLLLTSSVFIGLFAGAQHRLGLGHGGEEDNHTVTTTTTFTATTTSTFLSTSTRISTTTVVTSLPVPEPTKFPEEKPCLAPHCVILSASILSSLDTSQDPCENFYDFANGGWLKSHPLPADKGSFGTFEALSQENKQVIKDILESNSSVTPLDDEILSKLRGFYSSCMDENTLDDIGATPLLHFTKIIKRLYNGNDTDITSTSETGAASTGLTAAVAFLHSKGIDGLFYFDIEGDIGVDPSRMVLWFNQPELGLPSKEYFEEEPILDVYRSVLQRLLLALEEEEEEEEKGQQSSSPLTFVDNEDANVWPPWPWPPWGGDDDDGDEPPVNRTLEAQKLARNVVEFESKIAKASLDLDVLQQDPVATYNPAPLSNLTETVTQIHFPTYFSTFTPRSFPDRVIMTHPAYARSLSDILNETSSDVVEAYLITRAALALSPYLSQNTEAWQAQRTLLEALTGIKRGAVGDRAEYCIGQVEENLGFAAGRYFVNETFGGDSREKGTKVITDIVESFKASLKRIDWMDEESAKAAAEKADAIRVKVGFPLSPDTRDPSSIVRYYNNVKADKKNFFGNVLSSATSQMFKKWLQLGRSRDPEAWEMFPSTVNAYFNPPSNEIVFPAGILRPPFFSQAWPAYISYGSFGHVAAHELTHAFDSAGRLYNQEGKLEQWWTNYTSEGFKVKQDCIVEQYSSYYIDNGKGGKINVNGNLTSGENIGDTGLIQAYRAWKAQQDLSDNSSEYLLPGLNFTREQLFFISFARIWARAIKPAAAVQRIRTDPHSPNRFRVDGTVSNIPEFARAFKCSEGAKLNPPKEARCIFWS